MKIYFLLPDLSAGGAERVSITIARLLCKEGYNVEFVNFGFRVGEMLDWIESEFKMTCLECGRVLNAIPKLIAFMKAHPDSIYFSSREHVSIVGILAAKMTKRPIVVRIPNMPKRFVRFVVYSLMLPEDDASGCDRMPDNKQGGNRLGDSYPC